MLRTKRATGVLLLFDFDGTISELVDHPSKARMIEGWRERLIKLNKLPRVTVGIVSGRALNDIRNRAKVPGIIYVGSHGFEITKGSTRLLSIGREHHIPLKNLHDEIKTALRDIRGVEMEYKKTSVSVHYRCVASTQQAIVRRRVRAAARPLMKKHRWQITSGKKVMEVRPARQWNKGKGVSWIAKHLTPGSLPCYIGDDLTDEDAFRALGKNGISIRVGKSNESCANYFVEHVDELIPWLDALGDRS